MKKYKQLTKEDRFFLSALRKSNLSVSEIARRMNRSKSTISREINRNMRKSHHSYSPEVADSFSRTRRKNSRKGLHHSEEEMKIVFKFLKKKWSPEQISNHVKIHENIHISHETIYKHLLIDKKSGGDLYKHLRLIPKKRRKRYNSTDTRGRMYDSKHISERSKEIESRATIGHWEGDTVVGKGKHCILTLVERKSGFAIIKKIKDRKAHTTKKAILRAIRKFPELFKTITFDNGSEFYHFKDVEVRTGVQCYFATPYHSWERGSNENLNGLIRQYIPKRSCMSNLNQVRCDWISKQLNSRPRKRHNYKTPLEVLNVS